MGKDILLSNIFPVGTKFVVSNDTTDTTFGPGTTGFISFIKGHDLDYSNVVYTQAIIIRRGKTGKDRLNIAELSFPIFLVDNPKMDKYLPNNKRKFYVHIEQVPVEYSIMHMSPMDFLGWSLAYTQFVHKLSAKANRISVWPQASSNLLNKFLHLGHYFDESINGTVEDFCNADVRKAFIDKIRIADTTLMRCSLAYMIKLASLEVRAVQDLHALEIGPKEVMKTTWEEFRKKEKGLKELEQLKQSN